MSLPKDFPSFDMLMAPTVIAIRQLGSIWNRPGVSCRATRQTLHRMLSHSDTVSLKVFFNAIEQIHADVEE